MTGNMNSIGIAYLTAIILAVQYILAVIISYG